MYSAYTNAQPVNTDSICPFYRSKTRENRRELFSQIFLLWSNFFHPTTLHLSIFAANSNYWLCMHTEIVYSAYTNAQTVNTARICHFTGRFPATLRLYFCDKLVCGLWRCTVCILYISVYESTVLISYLCRLYCTHLILYCIQYIQTILLQLYPVCITSSAGAWPISHLNQPVKVKNRNSRDCMTAFLCISVLSDEDCLSRNPVTLPDICTGNASGQGHSEPSCNTTLHHTT